MAAVVLIVVAVGLRFGVPIYRQHVAIREIERCGGDVGGLLRIRRETGPTWLREFVGEDRMMAVDEIDDIYFHADSSTLNRRMNKLRYGAISMTTLDRAGPTIDDFTLSCITVIPTLKRLSLRFCDVGDAGMQHVAHLRNLEDLDLRCTDVSDAGLARLKTLRNLQSVDLNGTNVTDVGCLPDLQRLPG